MGKESVLLSGNVKLLLALLILQLCFAGFHIVSRLALNIGVSKIVYPVYRNIVALLLLGPSAYFLEKNERPPLTLPLLVQFFLLALLGVLKFELYTFWRVRVWNYRYTANQGFYLLGLYYLSPTFASAMQNSVPAITFLMASALGVEKVNISRRDGMAKILGTIASIGGATVISLYKGPPLLHQTVQVQGSTTTEEVPRNTQNWTWGCIYLLGHCLSWASWMVFQAPVLKKYPAKLSLTSFTCFFGLIQFLVIAAIAETDFEKWKIVSGEEVFTILYAGIISSGVVIALQTWCIHKGGPVFVAVFQPLQTFLVAIMATLILHDQLYSGGIIGAILIMIGLYLVLWGKNREKRVENQSQPLKEPLTEEESKEREDGEIQSDIPR